MSTAQLSMIAPPPSVEAVLGALTEETRIGQVDFSTRLAPEPEPEDVDEPDVTHADDLVAATEAEAEDDEDEAEDDESQETVQAEVVPASVVTLVSVPAIRDEVEEPSAEETPADEHGADDDGPGPADVPTTAAVDATETQEIVVDDAVVPASLEARIHEPARLRRFEEPALRPTADERPPTVEEIARLVIERMHDAELAMMRHLEAIEVEAARRAELLTAQAELDAELIRLSARREAHGIVTAARVRAGEDAEAATRDTRLDELAESLSRFAEVVDELHPAGARTPSWGRTP